MLKPRCCTRVNNKTLVEQKDGSRHFYMSMDNNKSFIGHCGECLLPNYLVDRVMTISKTQAVGYSL